MTEAELTKAVRSVLNTSGLWHFKHWGGPMSPRGIPDIIGIRCFKIQELIDMDIKKAGVFFGCELKRPGRKLTDDQEKVIRRIRMNGGIGFMADDVDTVISKLFLQKYFIV